MRLCRFEAAHLVGLLGVIGLALALCALLTGCQAATITPAVSPTLSPSAAATMETTAAAQVTPGPTATSAVIAAATDPGWARYTNLANGFTFAYPSSWSLVEVPATDDRPGAVWVRWEAFRLLVEYKQAGDHAVMQGYGSARNWRDAGSVPMLGLDVTREVLRVEGKVKRVAYRVQRMPARVGNLVLGVHLRSVAADECLGSFDLECDYTAVDLPQAVQDEADRMVASMVAIDPLPTAEDRHPGWKVFTRADYGFAFVYPPDWTLSEGRNFVALSQGTIRLVLGYGGVAEKATICCTLGSELARVRDEGTVAALGTQIRRGVIEDEGLVSAVVYNGGEVMQAGGRAFVAHLQGYSAAQEASGIPLQLLAEADEILESLLVFEPVLPLPGSDVVPTEEPATPTPEVVVPADAVVTGRDGGGNVRSGPGTLHEIVGFLDYGDEARVLGRFRDWWQIEFGGQPGWVANQVVLTRNTDGVPEVQPTKRPGATPPPEAGPVLVVGSGKLNVRMGPGTGYLKVGSLDPGAQVTVLGQHEDWWQIDDGGQQAWVSGEFATAYHVEAIPEVDVPKGAVSPNPDVIPPPARPSDISESRWVDIDLSDQRVTVYQDGTPIYQTLVSTGLPNTPTPTGQFRIWIKLRYDDMSGPGYYLEDVPYVMYFYQGYGFHGVWWHGNFGYPMSHGCVNLPNGADEWLFNWAEVGTLINVHE